QRASDRSCSAAFESFGGRVVFSCAWPTARSVEGDMSAARDSARRSMSPIDACDVHRSGSLPARPSIPALAPRGVAGETYADQLSELMQRYAEGEDSAFEELYRLMAPRLYRFCLRLAIARSDADDLLQETMLRIHRARSTYLAGSNPLHW